mgnify:CR=1 FL=1
MLTLFPRVNPTACDYIVKTCRRSIIFVLKKKVDKINTFAPSECSPLN